MGGITIVAAVSDNGVIGRAGRMPWHLPADLAHFKRITMAKPVIMGRRTFESIGCALPGRRNIVVTRRAGAVLQGTEVARSLDDALELVVDAEEVMVIGGSDLYREALPRARRMELTRVHADVEGDTWFPEFDKSQWRETARTERPADQRNVWALSFITLERKDN